MLERFWSKVDASGDCWEWIGARDPRGYGRFRFEGEARLAHRVAWGLLVGPIGVGLTLDHLCRNHPCVNPDHLEPVTQRVNVNRGFHRVVLKTHCPKGHPYEGENVRLERGVRVCRICRKRIHVEYRARLREALNG